MEHFIDYQKLEERKEELKKSWNDEKKPFRYIVFEDFFSPKAAEKIIQNYPKVKQVEPTGNFEEDPNWKYTTYVNQNNKFVMTEFDNQPIIKHIFDELNSDKLLKIIESITGIEDLQADPKLFGGGLHQSTKGAFLDVHVDFNYHPETNYHRRMNIIIYMNKDWKEEYEGYLELWDMDKKVQIENVEPRFNRCVIFETNEISFHGHPHSLNTPDGQSRKSIAAYYYTKTRPENEIAKDHNTVYVNVEGMKGSVKNLKTGVRAFLERINNKK